ncbi:MAG: hypothetical protein LBN36_06340, partial [Clostridiales Family XIII bacterium]|nr:hypothetical protein [Clostridiales Family XIII bacterium]
MSIIAERYALHYKTIGYHHYSREFEKKGIDQILKGELEQLSKLSVENLNVNTLADDPLRSLKNNMICMVTVIGRAVIDAGCDAEKSFAIGDSYIIRAERQTDIESVVTLGIE